MLLGSTTASGAFALSVRAARIQDWLAPRTFFNRQSGDTRCEMYREKTAMMMLKQMRQPWPLRRDGSQTLMTLTLAAAPAADAAMTSSACWSASMAAKSSSSPNTGLPHRICCTASFEEQAEQSCQHRLTAAISGSGGLLATSCCASCPDTQHYH